MVKLKIGKNAGITEVMDDLNIIAKAYKEYQDDKIDADTYISISTYRRKHIKEIIRKVEKEHENI